ncbi:hypothetical protein HanRHA438_Chr06g0281961 [Helianthus annuus]|nr:hypothetical protein HanRHA438_Chr06g0281961 [Helianthus annuus]
MKKRHTPFLQFVITKKVVRRNIVLLLFPMLRLVLVAQLCFYK